MIRKKLNREVAIVGSGISKYGPAGDGITTRDLFVEAYHDALKSVEEGLDPKQIEALYIGNATSDLFEHQMHIGPIMTNWSGLIPRPAIRIEDACASSGVAFREAVLSIASGVYDIVLAAGTEKMTNLPTSEVTEVLAYALDGVSEFPPGFTFPGVYAAMCTAHMAKWGTTIEDLMRVAIKSHNNAALNPKAHFNISIKDIMKNRREKAAKEGKVIPSWGDELDFLQDSAQNPVVAWPLRLFDCSTICDGASCVLLAAAEIARNFTDNPLYVIGTGQASDYPLHGRADLASIAATKYAASQAYEMAGVKPKDIKIAEVHDCFTIAEIVAMEDLGFFKPGEAVKAINERITERNGLLPINTGGGLKAKGHPVGATGTGQIFEIWEQMTGKAGPRQVVNKNIDFGLAQNVGAHGATVVVHIFEKR